MYITKGYIRFDDCRDGFLILKKIKIPMNPNMFIQTTYKSTEKPDKDSICISDDYHQNMIINLSYIDFYSELSELIWSYDCDDDFNYVYIEALAINPEIPTFKRLASDSSLITRSFVIQSFCHGCYRINKSHCSITFRFNQGRLHHETEPAIEMDYLKQWFIHGLRHRLNQPQIIKEDISNFLPAYILYNQYNQIDYIGYYIYGQLRCRKWKDGSIEWSYHDLVHRHDGPAVIESDYLAWYAYEQLHRLDGPAIMYRNDLITVTDEWYLHGKLTTESKVKQYIYYYNLYSFLNNHCCQWHTHL